MQNKLIPSGIVPVQRSLAIPECRNNYFSVRLFKMLPKPERACLFEFLSPDRTPSFGCARTNDHITFCNSIHREDT